jgi:hypothetical protein
VATTCASTTMSGWIVLGLGGRGNLSDVPELGGLKAERGRRGSVFGPLRRRPTWGGEGGVGICVLIIAGGML